MTARLPQELIEKLEGWAKAEKLSRSEAIRRLIEMGLKGKR
ncbi:MAG: ribbon-helix-helix domain-containing protein [Hyphomicrobiales bacterium]|nr:ribbon-helix-helix domain-containing protein [Hyphomicrobiales bacterium]